MPARIFYIYIAGWKGEGGSEKGDAGYDRPHRLSLATCPICAAHKTYNDDHDGAWNAWDMSEPVVLVGAFEGSFLASFGLGWGVTIGAGLASCPLDIIRQQALKKARAEQHNSLSENVHVSAKRSIFGARHPATARSRLGVMNVAWDGRINTRVLESSENATPSLFILGVPPLGALKCPRMPVPDPDITREYRCAHHEMFPRRELIKGIALAFSHIALAFPHIALLPHRLIHYKDSQLELLDAASPREGLGLAAPILMLKREVAKNGLSAVKSDLRREPGTDGSASSWQRGDTNAVLSRRP
ncbi:hypothetical protein BD779DRAFT_1476715 [Infundibulicybe gibba]|nr:hypothetical protein BD779DRAFT_1476715 [Infundibulicybe gibba]